MKTNWQWLTRNGSDFNWRFVVRVAKRVVYLFVAFNLLYFLIQPLESGRPTLYNGVFPGRLRMVWSKPGNASPVVSETKLPRLLADHVVSRPKQEDEYRILVLGSSETWGDTLRAQDTMPVVLDNMGLRLPDGRLEHSYNLAFVIANAFKDLLILRYVLADGDFRPDLILWDVTGVTFDTSADPHLHPLVIGNPDLALEVAQTYGLTGLQLEPIYADQAPWWRSRSFLAERDSLAYWLSNQVYGLQWAATGVDHNVPAEVTRRDRSGGEIEWVKRQPGVLEAFVKMANDYHVPVLLISTPANYVTPDYDAWLAQRADVLGVPLLDCSRLLPPHEFTDSQLHFTAYGHHLFAGQVAEWLERWWSTPASEIGRVTMCPTLD